MSAFAKTRAPLIEVNSTCNNVAAPNTGCELDPEQWVEKHADLLYRRALLRVRNPAVAEDLVQEVFLAAWRSRQKAGRVASEQAWLFGILRHKIADYFRDQAPDERPANELADFEQQQFDADHHWKLTPRRWPNPMESLERREFWSVLHGCTIRLPAKTAQAFVLREVEDLPTSEICEALKVEQNHLFVLLHRARLALRRCLEIRWFGQTPSAQERKG
jgi:RNA polymerase sigma-70 factor (ECF subfamily)